MKKARLFSYVLVAGLSLGVFSCSSEDEDMIFDEANKGGSHVWTDHERLPSSGISETKSEEGFPSKQYLYWQLYRQRP